MRFLALPLRPGEDAAILASIPARHYANLRLLCRCAELHRLRGTTMLLERLNRVRAPQRADYA